MVQFHSIACDYSFFPQTSFIEETILSTLCVLTKLVAQLTINASLYFLILCSVPLVYMSIFMPVPCFIDSYSFVLYFEIRKCNVSIFVLLAQVCFGHKFFCGSYEFLGLFFFSPVKNITGILIGVALAYR